MPITPSPVSRRHLVLALVLAVAGAASGCLSSDLNTPRASRMESVSGNAQTVAPSARTSTPLVVQVLDQNFQPMAGQTVRWAVAAGGGTVESPVTTTSATGQASTHYTAGTTTGTTYVTATLDGLGTITFSVIVAAAGG